MSAALDALHRIDGTLTVGKHIDHTINNIVVDTFLDESTSGAILSCFGNIAINVGMNLINIGQSGNTAEKDLQKRGISSGKASSATLLFGWALFILGNVINFTALSMAPQTLLSSLGSVQFIANLIFLGCIMGDPVTVRNVCGTLLVILGNTVIIFCYSPQGSGVYTMTELYNFFTSKNYEVYTASTLSFFILFQFITKHVALHWIGYVPIPRVYAYKTVEKHPSYTPLKTCSSPQSHFSISVSSPEGDTIPRLRSRYISDSSSGTQEVLTPTEVQYTPSPAPTPVKNSSLFGMFYSMSSAAIGVQALLTGKSLAVIARISTLGAIDILDPFNIFFALAVCIIFLGTSTFWLWRLSLSLKLFDAMFIIPINQTMWILFSVLSGGIVYNEFANLELEETLWLIGGLVLVLVGVALMMPVDKTKGENVETDQESGSPLRICCNQELNVRWNNGSKLLESTSQIQMSIERQGLLSQGHHGACLIPDTLSNSDIA